jgi:hypothetical protein
MLKVLQNESLLVQLIIPFSSGFVHLLSTNMIGKKFLLNTVAANLNNHCMWPEMAASGERGTYADEQRQRMESDAGATNSVTTAIGEGTSQPDACNDLSEVGGKSQESKGIDNVKVVAYTEVGAVAYSEIRDGFTVLVHLKAPCASRRPRNGGSSSPWALSPLREGMKGRDISLESPSPSPSPPHVSGPGFRAPLDLVTVLDVSGSMAGTKLVLLKRAMGFVIRNLTPVDRLSVVVFSSTAKRLFPLRRMVQDGRQSALRAIEALVSTGGTNIAEGLRKGAKVRL